MNEALTSVLDLFSNSNIFLLLASFIPAFLYSLLIYVTGPYKSINFRKGLLYMMIGTISVFFIFVIHIIFPQWRVPVSDDYITALLVFAFIQVSLTEEFSKFVSFKLINGARGSNSCAADHPLATMYYSTMVALGFGFAETFHYAMTYGSQVVIIRAFTAILAHMLCGLFMGYFYSLGRTDFRLGLHSALDIFLNKRKRIKAAAFTLAGVIVASVFHGMYDYNLF